MSAAEKKQHRIFMGLGEAVLRLMHVEILNSRGIGATETLKAERELIVASLNQQYQLDLGFDCDSDGIPDSIEIFTASAQTACCRLNFDAPESKPKKVRGKSRGYL
jgi:hypothetical protein